MNLVSQAYSSISLAEFSTYVGLGELEAGELASQQVKINGILLHQFGCGISKMVGPKKQEFRPRIKKYSKEKKKKIC